MAPSEESILQSFLLRKAGLRDVLTLAEFSHYFPASKRANPHIRLLYRDLQSQRNAICESTLKQINLECRLGETIVAQRRAGNRASTADDPAQESNLECFVPDLQRHRLMHSYLDRTTLKWWSESTRLLRNWTTP
jgi:Cnl2/NKP2 family protein